CACGARCGAMARRARCSRGAWRSRAKIANQDAWDLTRSCLIRGIRTQALRSGMIMSNGGREDATHWPARPMSCGTRRWPANERLLARASKQGRAPQHDSAWTLRETADRLGGTMDDNGREPLWRLANWLEASYYEPPGALRSAPTPDELRNVCRLLLNRSPGS